MPTATYYTESRLAAMLNWADALNLVSEGNTQDIKMREVVRLVILKVMQQNNLDVLVNPTTTIPPAEDRPCQPAAGQQPAGRPVPDQRQPWHSGDHGTRGFQPNRLRAAVCVECRQGQLQLGGQQRRQVHGHFAAPGGISFWAGVGGVPNVLKVASIYEAATRHRTAPAALGPLQDP